MKYAIFDSSGFATAFYDDQLNNNIPADAVELIDAAYDDLIDNQGRRRMDANNIIVAHETSQSLDDLKTLAKNRIKRNCNDAIESGVVVGVLGTDHTYPTTKHDQDNLDAIVQRARIHGAAKTYKFWCADADGYWARRVHTDEQIIAVGEVVIQHVIDRQDKYEIKLAEIEAATMQTELDAVVW